MGYDLGQCERCNKKAITATEAGERPLCAYHYIEEEDEACLEAILGEDIDEHGKITECRLIQLEIKKQMPKLYKKYEGYFDV